MNTRPNAAPPSEDLVQRIAQDPERAYVEFTRDIPWRRCRAQQCAFVPASEAEFLIAQGAAVPAEAPPQANVVLTFVANEEPLRVERHRPDSLGARMCLARCTLPVPAGHPREGQPQMVCASYGHALDAFDGFTPDEFERALQLLSTSSAPAQPGRDLLFTEDVGHWLRTALLTARAGARP